MATIFQKLAKEIFPIYLIKEGILFLSEFENFCFENSQLKSNILVLISVRVSLENSVKDKIH